MTRPSLTVIAMILLSGVVGLNAAAAGSLTGSQYLHQAAQLKAVSSGSTAVRSADYGGKVLDIAGTLSGTVGSGSHQCAMLLDDGIPYVVRTGAVQLPPFGADIRVLAKMSETSPSFTSGLTLVAWAFTADVLRAEATPRQSLSALDARRRGPAPSRGGADAIDHTQFFREYSRAIAGLNAKLSVREIEDITAVLLNTSRDLDMDPRFVMAMVLAESGFNPSATSRKGAMGLGQLMPGTAAGMGLSDPYDAKQNLDAAIKILRSSISKYSGGKAWKDVSTEHLKLALAAYNAGSGAVKKYGGVPPYRETQNYIAKVLSYYRQLCGEK